MRRSSTLAIWLTLIMLLMVSAAAVFFMFQRYRELEEDLRQAALLADEKKAASEATRGHLLSDVAVRQAALDAASATRDTLAAESELSVQQLQDLESSLAQSETSLTEAQAALLGLSLQLFIISPADGATVPPQQRLDIIATARAEAGLDTMLLTVNGQELARLPADGQTTLTAQADWIPPGEGTFVINGEVLSLDGQATTASVTVNAAYASPEAREAALNRQMQEEVTELRFPAPATIAADVMPELAQPDGDALHRLLLTGRQADDEQTIADEAFALQALDLLFSDAGLRTYLDSVASSDLRAFYDLDSGSLTLYEPVEPDGAFGRWSGIDQLTHDLQNERFGLNEMDIAALDDDARIALRALVEGDATFLEYLALQGEMFSAEELAEITVGLSESATDVSAALPITLQETFEFAYMAGVPFVKFLYDLDGFDTVDGAWSELPASSEHIIHPERYLARDVPAPVALNPLENILGQGWRLADTDVFGEFLLRQHLGQQPLTAEAIDQAATGWGGGRYAVYHNVAEALPVLVIRLAWDNAEHEREFSALYADYLQRRFGGAEQATAGGGRCWLADGAGCLFKAGGDSLIVRAPTLELATAVAEVQINMSQS
jgi:hypothetical protein